MCCSIGIMSDSSDLRRVAKHHGIFLLHSPLLHGEGLVAPSLTSDRAPSSTDGVSFMLSCLVLITPPSPAHSGHRTILGLAPVLVSDASTVYLAPRGGLHHQQLQVDEATTP